MIDFEAAQEMDIDTGYGEGARMVREAEYEMDRVRIILGS